MGGALCGIVTAESWVACRIVAIVAIDDIIFFSSFRNFDINGTP